MRIPKLNISQGGEDGGQLSLAASLESELTIDSTPRRLYSTGFQVPEVLELTCKSAFRAYVVRTVSASAPDEDLEQFQLKYSH